MAKDPRGRFAGVIDFVDALERALFPARFSSPTKRRSDDAPEALDIGLSVHW
jgi:hypothetical protein